MTSIFVKIESNLKKKITKMLSEKFSTNPESFKGFGRGRRVDLATSHGYTHIKNCIKIFAVVKSIELYSSETVLAKKNRWADSWSYAPPSFIFVL